MIKTLSTTVLTLTATALIVAGCGGSTDSATTASDSSAASSTSGTPSVTTAPPFTDNQAPPNRLVVDVTIKGGEVTPTNEPLQAALGDPIVIRVNSDAADELHVHSTPEHSFPIEPKQGQSFQFTVDVPGKVDIELHQLKKTIATITVQ